MMIFMKNQKLMKKIYNGLLFVLSFIWQLPQSLVGLLMLIYFLLSGGVKLISYRKLCFAFEAKAMMGGISLGNFAFLSPTLSQRETSIAHEQLGHTVQSKILGPLYLFVIGIPSILNAEYHFTKCYYDFYTEKNANKFAGLVVVTNKWGRCEIAFPDETE